MILSSLGGHHGYFQCIICSIDCNYQCIFPTNMKFAKFTVMISFKGSKAIRRIIMTVKALLVLISLVILVHNNNYEMETDLSRR